MATLSMFDGATAGASQYLHEEMKKKGLVMKYTVYSKPACPHCDSAKSLLKSKGLEYDEVILDVGQPKVEGLQYISREDLLAKLPLAKTMPQIIKSNVNSSFVIGGFTELREHLAGVI